MFENLDTEYFPGYFFCSFYLFHNCQRAPTTEAREKKKKVKKKSIKSCIFILELMRSKLKNHDRNVKGCGKLWFNLFFWICIPFC